MNHSTSPEAFASVDLNAAGKDELCASLPGIGPVLADRIVAFREGHGPFGAAEELARVPGIGSRLAGRLSDRVRVRAATEAEGVRVEIEPLAPLSLEHSFSRCPSAAPAAEGRLSEEVGAVVVSRDDAVPALASAAPPDERAVVLAMPRRRATLTMVTVTAILIGTATGAWMSERKAGAATASVDNQVQALRVDERDTRDELKRQDALLTETKEALAMTVAKEAAVEESLRAAEARAEARNAHLAREVTELAERTQRAQARTDARVYQLDDALKLIDWVTTTGYARSVATQKPASSVKP